MCFDIMMKLNIFEGVVQHARSSGEGLRDLSIYRNLVLLNTLWIWIVITTLLEMYAVVEIKTFKVAIESKYEGEQPLIEQN